MEGVLKKFDDELQVVYGEVYAPDVPDSDGDYMSADEIQKMAHNFMRSGRLNSIDTDHDNDVNGSHVVESFIAFPDSEIFIAGSWVVGVHVPDPEMWAKVKSGELNGFSMEAFVHWEDRILEIEVPPVIKGKTSLEGSDHAHEYTVRFNEVGDFLGGSTDTVDGHSHQIFKGTVTEKAGNPKHQHRYSFIEALQHD